MVIKITSDADMPQCLNTQAKQFKKAKELAQSYQGAPVKSARNPSPQGFFSRTVIITMKTGEELVIQFRPEPLDMEPFKEARAVLGDVVPAIEQIEDEAMSEASIWVDCMTCIPGETWWSSSKGRSAQGRVKIVKSLGQILSKGYVAGDTTRPFPFHIEIKSMLEQVDSLTILPLYISHFDLNDVNIMVDKDCNSTGIVDWELSNKLPFGMGLCRIHTLAGFYSQGKFVMPTEFHEAERAFWNEIFVGMSKEVRATVEHNLDLVNLSLRIGVLLDTFQLDEGRVGGINDAALAALPEFLTYRIPQSRADEGPYRI